MKLKDDVTEVSIIIRIVELPIAIYRTIACIFFTIKYI